MRERQCALFFQPRLKPLHYVEVPKMAMLTCPHCGQRTTIACAEEFAFIDVGRFTCEHCEKEFLVLDNVPMREQWDW
jgi:transposase-like protein